MAENHSGNLDCGGLSVGTTLYCSHTPAEPQHYHENPTICFMINGGAVEKRNRIDYERYPCDARFYHSGEPHQSSIRLFPSRCLNLEFEREFFDYSDISESTICKTVAKDVGVKSLMLKVHSEFLAADEFTKDSIKMLLLGRFRQSQAESRKHPQWLGKLQQIITDRWAETLTLDELSAEIGVHPVTISKHFSKYFSCTLGEYIRKLRVEKSIPVIRNSRIPLTDIALDCGFSDQSHFIRNFKKFTGFLPGELRRI